MLKSHFNLRPDDSGEQEETVEEEQASEAAEEEKVVHPVRKLNRFEVCGRLSLLGKTAEGDGYTYLKAKCTGMSLTDISGLKYYKHLQFVDVSDNHLDLDALQVLTDLQFLVLIHADKNILHSAALKKMKYLQVIIMNYNLITSVHDIYQPELSTLEVGYNKIERVSFDNRMPNIKCLDFRYNTIEDISNLDFPKLDSLYLAGNKITSLVLTALDTLVMKGCPYMGGSGEENADLGNEEEDTEVRIEVLAALPRLKRINKGVVTPEERAEAKDLMMQWLEEGDKDEEEIDEEINEQESNAD
ncbi:leucine-rich repeat-containing protein 23-like isoform X2 [Achroia grisella]|uniref:leucine-rich repeat-containing protein 23-like isoform X2 n=1 Tax=Achroia grisella TaxID=688607 RepID=UPI0027D30497|nr:leucine-rich repeat-containing protein 23-like isoform X2 [Achroia grisella]